MMNHPSASHISSAMFASCREDSNVRLCLWIKKWA